MSLVYSALLSVSHVVPYDNNIMTRNGYGLIEGTITFITEGLRKSRQTFVTAADTQASRINSRILSSVNLIIRMIKTTSGYQFDSTITTANCLEVLVHIYIYIHTPFIYIYMKRLCVYVYTHRHTHTHTHTHNSVALLQARSVSDHIYVNKKIFSWGI